MNRRRAPREQGSIPLVLLAVLAIGSVTAVLSSTMVLGQRQTRSNQSSEQALQLAEQGLDRLAAQVTSRQVTSTFPLATPPPGVSGTASRTAGGWQLEARGTTPDGRSRRLQAAVELRSVFNLPAFGRVGVDYNGANGARSYRSGTWSEIGGTWTFTPVGYDTYLNTNNDLIAPNGNTGRGIVATNGNLVMKGGAFEASDGARIHNARERVADPLPGATGYCGGVTATCAGWTPDNLGKLRYSREPITLPAVQLPRPPSGSFDGRDGRVLAPGVHVFTSAYLDSSTVIQGTPMNPTILYLTGQLAIPNHARVNFTTHNGRAVPRPAPSLRIYSASEGTAMHFGSSVQLSAGVYAPRGAFGGGSQGVIWGSMIVNSIDNNGGTRFVYDEALAEVDDNSPLVMSRWREVSPAP